jgi:hypothetical protein
LVGGLPAPNVTPAMAVAAAAAVTSAARSRIGTSEWC